MVWYDMVWFVWYCYSLAVCLVLALVVVLIVGLVGQEHVLPTPSSLPPSILPSLPPSLYYSLLSIFLSTPRGWSGWSGGRAGLEGRRLLPLECLGILRDEKEGRGGVGEGRRVGRRDVTGVGQGGGVSSVRRARASSKSMAWESTRMCMCRWSCC